MSHGRSASRDDESESVVLEMFRMLRLVHQRSIQHSVRRRAFGRAARRWPDGRGLTEKLAPVMRH
jgi:hypothetical protein